MVVVDDDFPAAVEVPEADDCPVAVEVPEADDELPAVTVPEATDVDPPGLPLETDGGTWFAGVPEGANNI